MRRSDTAAGEPSAHDVGKTKRYDVGPEHGFRTPTTIKLTEKQAYLMGLTDADVSAVTTTADARPRPAAPSEVPDGYVDLDDPDLRARTVHVPSGDGLTVTEVIAESRLAAQQWDPRIWRRS